MKSFIAGLVLTMLAGCGNSANIAYTFGNPVAGRVTVTRQACGSCHIIAGIEEADGLVGPPLSHFASQRMIAGVLPNSPAMLERFLRSPQSVVDGGEMPNMGLTPKQARDIGAYLYTLR